MKRILNTEQPETQDLKPSGFYERLTGKKPTTLKEFFERGKILFQSR